MFRLGQKNMPRHSLTPRICRQLFVVSLFVVVFTAAVHPTTIKAEPAKNSPDAVSAAKRFTQIFDEICYSALPDLAPVISAAKERNWTPVTGSALQAFAPEAPATTLQAWSFTEAGSKLQIAISSSPADAALAEALPAFAKATAFGCSLILPGTVPPATLETALEKMVGRAPDESFHQKPFNATLWSGITDELAALLYHYKPDSGHPGGLISFVVLKK